MAARRTIRPRVALHDRRGAASTRRQVFTLDADREDMAHFLRIAGYLFVREVFAPDEVAAFVDEAQAAARARRDKGDKLSWWGKNAAGDEVLCRVTRGVDEAAAGDAAHDARLRALIAWPTSRSSTGPAKAMASR